MKASVGELNRLAGWWRRPSGTLMQISRYVSAQGTRYPREKVQASLYKPDGTPIQGGHGEIQVVYLRRLIRAMEYRKVADEYTPIAEVIA